MSSDVAYELHAYAAGKWKIQGFFDDKDLALAEARRMEGSPRYPALRVVEERYDESAGGYRARTIYRSSAMDQENEAALKELAQVRREVEATRDRGRPAAPSAAGRTPNPAASHLYMMLVAKAVAIFAFGFAAIYALNQLAGS